MIEAAKRPEEYKGPSIKFYIRNMDASNRDTLKGIFNEIKDSEIGLFSNERGIGSLADEVYGVFEERHFKTYPLIDFLEEVLSVKDKEEQSFSSISGKYSAHLLQTITKVFEKAIDDGKKINHQAISNKIKELTEKAEFINRFKQKVHSPIDLMMLDIGMIPVVQSGENINFDLNAVSNSSTLQMNIINCRVSARYKDYFTYVVRTYMIDCEDV